jgi:hypothetical protein
VEDNFPNKVHPLTPKNEDKIRTYQNGKIVLNSADFEGLLDVFRTLLQWSKDLEGDRK